jgi:hypothetical protein
MIWSPIALQAEHQPLKKRKDPPFENKILYTGPHCWPLCRYEDAYYLAVGKRYSSAWIWMTEQSALEIMQQKLLARLLTFPLATIAAISGKLRWFPGLPI